MDPDRTFSVGLIYGPSGCGKSSLVQAGLLPRLSDDVRSVYVEASPGETETRLLGGLRNRCPGLSTNLDLKQTLATIRLGHGIPAGQKVLIVLDQFEQWLHANKERGNPELVQALRQCDGSRLRCIVMVRDDFWLAVSRFMVDLEVDLVAGRNITLVDMFDLDHAQMILAALGRALGRLPENGGETSREQKEFLKQAVKGLANEGKVVCVRLALFAEMMKGKPWTLAALKEVGGTEGIGVAFLEETFSARTANPKHHRHQKAARAVLSALLPDSGANIKGRMRSYAELLEVSGYSGRAQDFDQLIQLLDKEVRLITPTEPEGVANDEGWVTGDHSDRQSPPSTRYYQLAHDYLVPSLQDWLTRKQKETRRGRAELRLAELSELWDAKRENRRLPSLLEWANIRLLTRNKDWTGPQAKMMKRAGFVHGMQGVGTTAALVALLLFGLNIRGRVIEASDKTVAAGLVDQVLKVKTAEVPEIVKRMTEYRQWVDPALRTTLGKASDSSAEKLHASLALLPIDGDRQADYLYQRLLIGKPDEIAVVRNALKDHAQPIIPNLWGVLDSSKTGDVSLLPTASALADYDAESPHWESTAGNVAGALVSANPVFLGPWLDVLRPVRGKLIAPLAAIFRNKSHSESERTLATNILADYAGDDPGLIAELLMDADPKPYAALFPVAQRLETKTLALFRAEIAKKATVIEGRQDLETAKDQLAERQARAAIALLRMGKAEEVMPLLRHSLDPRLRSFVVNWLKPLGADPNILAAELARLDSSANDKGLDSPATHHPSPTTRKMDAILFHPETSQRRALILAMGTYGRDGLSPGEREPLIAKLLDLYRNDPDSGIHGSAEWTLRKWGQGEQLKLADAELSKLKGRGDRRWYVNSLGQTFAVIEGPVQFLMGSPASETDRESDETPHKATIPRRFAIASKEVTVEQYRPFARTNPLTYGVKEESLRRYAPDPDCPMISFSWYIAAAYCDWLSKQEGIPKDQWCYQRNGAGLYGPGMKVPADVLGRTGYRLPTEAEWEYACRAGTVTSRYYGRSPDLLDRYARYSLNSRERAWTSGSLLPSDLGGFDMLGSLFEWTQHRHELYPKASTETIDESMNVREPIMADSRVLRGLSIINSAFNVRSAYRSWNPPGHRYFYQGFRPCRTYP